MPPETDVVRERRLPAGADNKGNRAMIKHIRNLKNDAAGASAAEYALIIALVGVAIITGATALGTSINGKLQGVASKIDSASVN